MTQQCPPTLLVGGPDAKISAQVQVGVDQSGKQRGGRKVDQRRPRLCARNETMSDSGPNGILGQAVSRSVEDFDAMYSSTPPWDIGRPQPVFVRLAEAGLIRGRVLDVGCGTGEHVLMVAERGVVNTSPATGALAVSVRTRSVPPSGPGGRWNRSRPPSWTPISTRQSPKPGLRLLPEADRRRRNRRSGMELSGQAAAPQSHTRLSARVRSI
jgi:hypothetical protein